MKQSDRSFATKFGAVLATAGSAVGLGNVWRFPYMTGQDGGAAFILVYIVCVLMLGIPGMISEFIIGRHAGSNAARAYRRLAAGKAWMAVGVMGVLTSMIILGFYAVVAGWCLQYLYAAIAGQLSGDAAYVARYFDDFTHNPVMPAFWAVAFIGLTHFVVVHGIRSGIEKVSNLLMPTLFVLLLVLVGASCILPGAWKGVDFLLNPDFSKVSGSVFLDALGQAFFSLSLGTACLCTYASYFSRSANLTKSACQIAFIDMIVAILAGLMIFPAAFSVGISPDSGPSLIFITLPNVFNEAFVAVPVLGWIISLLFYVLLSLAALTSLMSLHEVNTSFFYEELKIGRKSGALIVSVSCAVIGAFCSLSLGATDALTFAGKSLFDWFDFVTGQVFLPVAGFLTCLFIGWYVPKKLVRDEFTNWGTLKGNLFFVYLFLVRFVCPVLILLVFLNQLGLLEGIL